MPEIQAIGMARKSDRTGPYDALRLRGNRLRQSKVIVGCDLPRSGLSFSRSSKMRS